MKTIFIFLLVILSWLPGEAASRDANGNVVLKIDEATQKRIGLAVEPLAAVQFSPEVKGYGRVLDPAPLSGLLGELAEARAAYTASSNELARLKTLQEQGNTSSRALETAEAAALHDQLTIQSARDRLSLEWGDVARQNDFAPLVRSLVSQEAALVRVDLPASDILKAMPSSARLVTLSGTAAEGKCLGVVAAVDPITQGQGFLFVVKPNKPRLSIGQALIAHLKIPGAKLTGVVLPRDAVIRSQGAAWVYIQSGKDLFTRLQVALDHPTDAGWLVRETVKAGDKVVTARAATLLSEEMKAAIVPDRD